LPSSNHDSGIDRSNVQGLVGFGYAALTEAKYLLLRVKDAAAARNWCRTAPVTSAEFRGSAPDVALQLAFTAQGLRALGVAEHLIAGFSAEFIGGMHGDHNRSRRLGDTGGNAPEMWHWGSGERVPHVLVAVMARKGLADYLGTIRGPSWDEAFETLVTLTTSNLNGSEQFGFRDGLSQPQLDWKHEIDPSRDTIDYRNRTALGEFLLGYPNEYGKYTDRPLVDQNYIGAGLLRAAEDAPQKRDLGRDGTYLVLRQLEQDVRRFWQFLKEQAGGEAAARRELAAAMVGRTLDGDPLVQRSASVADVTDAPDHPRNSFNYDEDQLGTQCPLGAHVRRANPRTADFFGRPDSALAQLSERLGFQPVGLRDDLLASSRFHRILRRGREYGPGLQPDEALRPESPDEPTRGLHFVCLNANISRQFEFVQGSWLISSKFAGLSGEQDTLLGNRRQAPGCPFAEDFSIPRVGRLGRVVTKLPQFVTVRGGAYFFLPSLSALRFIAREWEK
jgi:deferrochelatase/peroxidase EfeB